MKILDQNKPVNIVCYGDSNTKYYLGDLQQDGPEADSYPAKLQELFRAAGFDNVRVHNCGFPDTQTDFAVANFQAQVVDNEADICIFGFGTNCVRQEDADLEGYLDDMAHLFSLCKQRSIAPMSLLIPWYAEDYCGKEGQMRLPGWNSALCELCMVRDVAVLDTYNAFSADPDTFFSEVATPKRHYSAAATDAIARMAFSMIAPWIR
jgi:hypothetical protein